MDKIERYDGKIVLHPTGHAWWNVLKTAPSPVLWFLQVLAMSIRMFLIIGAGLFFFALWLPDPKNVLWIICTIVLIFSVALTSKIVLYIRRERGAR